MSDPVEFSSSASAKAPVRDAGGEGDIFAYLSMPVEEYTSDVLAGGQIRRIGDNLFILDVPRLSIFSIWLKPSMTVTVDPDSAAGCVKLTATNCTIRGSPLIESLNINQAFVVEMQTYLNYLKEPSEFGAPSEYLQAVADITVTTENLAPFKLIPHSVLSSTATSVVSALLGSMLRIFINKLAADYTRWSCDAAYREERQKAYLKPPTF